jgi:hypothetical protein
VNNIKKCINGPGVHPEAAAIKEAADPGHHMRSSNGKLAKVAYISQKMDANIFVTNFLDSDIVSG